MPVAAAARLRVEPAPRHDAGARAQVVGDELAQLRARDVDEREPVVERHRLEQRAVGERARRQVGAQAAAVGHRDLGVGLRREHEIGEQVALGGLVAYAFVTGPASVTPSCSSRLLAARASASSAICCDRRVDHDRLALVRAGMARRRPAPGCRALVERAYQLAAGKIFAAVTLRAVEREVDAAERASLRVRLDHRHAVDAVRDPPRACDRRRSRRPCPPGRRFMTLVDLGRVGRTTSRRRGS